MLQLVWFKRDLRTVDHEPLHAAASRGPVLPLYVVEPGLWEQPDASGRQWAFWRESLLSLRAELAALGQPLVVRQGQAVDVLGNLLRRHRVEMVWSHQETGNAWTFARDRDVAALLRQQGIAWHEARQHGIVRGRVDRDHWSKQWESLMRTPQFAAPRLSPVAGIEPGPIPEWPSPHLPHDDCPGRQPGGRIYAGQVLHSFLHARGERYHLEMSSPTSAATGCSRLSAHLASGTLSMREVVQATRARRASLRQEGASRGPTWARALAAFEGRLHWHCHFMQKLESEPRIEFENLQAATQPLRNSSPDPERLDAWINGRTGWPLVDACMRALAHTGWINFRMRAMLTSVASYQLWLHWREPGLHLARRFVDYEPGIHWSQLQMQSGTTGINTLRIYNPVKQSRDQDPHGVFIRTWVPELGPIETRWIHEPWLMPMPEQNRCGVVIGRDYPQPLVDHEAAARLARQRIQAIRRDATARTESHAIFKRHGSRKRAGQRRAASNRQADLFDDGAR
ncbi:MAG: deoxyribodipyrimidine photo-lyase [Gammaproteobacteria bacterium]|nr:deoxyribodipyrimidine photo-lyase [Gammaproteobacteria bacterium]